jgi:hypothetical protein
VTTVPAAAVQGTPSPSHEDRDWGQTGIYTLNCNEQCKLRSIWYGHASMSSDMRKEPILQMGPSKMIPRYTFNKTFMVKFPDRTWWENWFFPDNLGINLVYRWVQDKWRHWCSVVWVCYKKSLSFSLGQYITLFQTEVYAVMARTIN